MKRVVSNRYITAARYYDSYKSINRDGHKFSVHFNNIKIDSPHDMIGPPDFQVSELHPYDDGEYAWARTSDDSATYVEFIKGGKLYDGMSLPPFDPDEYEDYKTGFEKYTNDMILMVIDELKDMNKTVKPRMVNW